MTGGVGIHQVAARGYQQAGDLYERARPLYPAEAIDLLVRRLRIRPTSRVLDLAAGSGKLTRLLTPTGAAMAAVEPVPGMLRHLVDAVPGARVLAGTAEAIPLRRGSVDAVLVGSAFHWFDGDRALGEIHRVLRGDGGLGLVWNNPDVTYDWVARIWEMVGRFRGDVPSNRTLRWQEAFSRTDLFTALRHRRFTHTQELAPADLLARVASISFVAVLPDDERAHLLGRVREVVTSHAALAGNDRLNLPHITDVYWCRRRDTVPA